MFAGGRLTAAHQFQGKGVETAWRRIMKIILCLVLGVFLCAFPALSFDADSSCVSCHGDEEKLEQLGFPQLHLDPAVVDEEVGMAGVPTCVDCHLGNSAASGKEEDHRAMLRLL